MRPALPFVLVLAGLAACGPVSLAEAERQCVERARLARSPVTELAVGVGSGGRVGAAIDLTVSSDYIAGRDPSAVYDSCVMSKAGEPPSRPLYARPDWRG